MTSLITLAELDLYTNQTLTAKYPADYLEDLITELSAAVEDYCGGVGFFSQRTVTEEVKAWYENGNLVLFLPSSPVLAISGAEYLWTEDHRTTPISLTNAVLDLPSRMVFVPAANIYPNTATFPALASLYTYRIRATYIVGYATVPVGAKIATALLVQEQTQAGDNAARGRTGPLQSFRQGQYSETYAINLLDKNDKLGMGTELSRRAKQRLERFRGAGIDFVGGRPVN